MSALTEIWFNSEPSLEDTLIVLFPEDGATPQELLKNADTAMYHAKDGGKGRYEEFDASMHQKIEEELETVDQKFANQKLRASDMSEQQ